MSGFKNQKFVNEFAYRTKLNYYYQKKQFTKDEREIKRIEYEIEEIKTSMSINGFDIADYYEVTDLINSLIGLLVFPEQEAFNNIPTREKDLEEKFPKLYKSKSDDADYKNEYEKKKKQVTEKNSPQDIIKHMRNAVAHRHIGIKPNSCTIGGRSQIISITFEDYPYDKDDNTPNNSPPFSFTIKITDLEDVLMEICDYLINVNG